MICCVMQISQQICVRRQSENACAYAPLACALEVVARASVAMIGALQTIASWLCRLPFVLLPSWVRAGGSLWDERGMSTDSLWCVPSGFATNLIECSQPLDAVTSERNTHTQANTNIPIAFVNEQRFAQHLRLPHQLAALLAY